MQSKPMLAHVNPSITMRDHLYRNIIVFRELQHKRRTTLPDTFQTVVDTVVLGLTCKAYTIVRQVNYLNLVWYTLSAGKDTTLG